MTGLQTPLFSCKNNHSLSKGHGHRHDATPPTSNDAQVAPTSPTGKDHQEMTLHNYKILIVDDSKSVLYKLQQAFASTAYEVTTVDDPLKAYQMIENEQFHIVISDIVMPKLDGLTLLRKIKNYNGMIQVLMITGDITINNTLNAFRYGAVDIFFKPIEDMAELIKAVDATADKLDRINAILHKLTM
ncbi:MAG: response regulator [Desulfobulbaceae bacterium]|nr:response regulator [Desulfobulbaceae bacterium]